MNIVGIANPRITLPVIASASILQNKPLHALLLGNQRISLMAIVKKFLSVHGPDSVGETTGNIQI